MFAITMCTSLSHSKIANGLVAVQVDVSKASDTVIPKGVVHMILERSKDVQT